MYLPKGYLEHKSASVPSSSTSRMNRINISSYSYEMRPRLLKELILLDDSSLPSSSASSHSRLLPSGSKSASIPIAAIHKASEAVIKAAIKFFPFASIVKPTSLLRRTISSRKKSTRDTHRDSALLADHQQVTPKIKDILRWKSFRDVDTDLTPEDLNSLGHDHGDEETCYFMDQKNKMEGRFSFDEKEQLSPVSVLNDSPFRDDHDEAEPAFVYDRTVATMEIRKSMLMQRIAEFEALAKLEPFTDEASFTKEEKSRPKEEEETNSEVETKARQLLGHVKATSSSTKNNNSAALDDDDEADNVVLLEFFRHELGNNKQKDVELSEGEMLKMAEAWMNREYCEGTFDSELLDNRKAFLKDMEIGPMRWRSNNFFEEQQDLGRDLEAQVFNDLLDELWADLHLVSCD